MRESVLIALIVAAFWTVLSLPPLLAGGKANPDGARLAPQGLEDAAEPASPRPSAQAEQTDGSRSSPGPADGAAEPSPDFDAHFRLPVLQDGQTVPLDLYEYLTGVLLAEMPASFPEEALKAQAVASRTYALRSYRHRRHDAAALCTDSGCCQGWRDPAQADPAARARAEAAVRATDGLVIRYEGELIDATFFSCSGGQTEDAAAVWGSDLPYLRAVESPGEEGAAHFSDETRVPLAEFRAGLEELDPELRLPEDPADWIGPVTRTAGGGVETITLGGRPFTGKALRKRFGLRSTAFRLRLDSAEAVFETRGYGHRVGMSQYGAEAMARAGNDFETILKWYYRGVTVEPYEGEKN